MSDISNLFNVGTNNPLPTPSKTTTKNFLDPFNNEPDLLTGKAVGGPTSLSGSVGINVFSFLNGAGPVFVRIGVGALGVGLMVAGLVIMAVSSKTVNDVAGAVAGTAIKATPTGIAAAVTKAAI